MRRWKVHEATVLYVSATKAPSQLGIRCRVRTRVPVVEDVEQWRASFQAHRVTCARCKQQRRRT